MTIPLKRPSAEPEPEPAPVKVPKTDASLLEPSLPCVPLAYAAARTFPVKPPSLPPSSPPAVDVPSSPPLGTPMSCCAVTLGDHIALTLNTSFGGVPAIQLADFYKADTRVLRRESARLWTVLRESVPAAVRTPASSNIVWVESLSFDASDPNSSSVTSSSGPDDASCATDNTTDPPTDHPSGGVDWSGSQDACTNENNDADDLLDDEDLDDVLYDSDSEPEDLLASLLPSAPNAGSSSATLTLHTYLLSGRVFSAFAGKASYTTSCGLHSTTLVAKIHRPSTHTAAQLYEAAAEAAIYARLPQGIAPRYHGLFVKTAGERLVAGVLEHAGTPLASVKAARALSGADKEAIVALYARLHAAGVVHVSCSPKHWLRSDGAFRLIDFGCRWVLGGAPTSRVIDSRTFVSQAAEEMGKVRRTLGLPLWAKC